MGTRSGVSRTPPGRQPGPGLSPRWWIGGAGFLVGAAALQLLAVGRVPSALCNDAAEEGLRGLLLIAERRSEVITFTVGNSAETLWLYIVGLAASLLGPTWLALTLPGLLAATVCVGLGALLVRRLVPECPRWVPLAVFASSLWLFHYGQSGLRAISAPLFVLVVALLVDRMEESPRAALAAGGAAALSVYAYTACRILPVALAVHLAVCLVTAGQRRARVLRAALLAVGSGIVVSIPNLVFLWRRPDDFLGRGAYVLPPDPGAALRNLVATILLPFDYPDRYRSLAGDEHFFDGVSASFSASGFDPVDLPTAVAFLAGLWILRRRLARSGAFLLSTLVVADAVLGPSGPSLTRLLIVLPVFLVFASAGIGFLAARGRSFAAATALALTLLAGIRFRSYLVAFEPGGRWAPFLSPGATVLGRRAAERAGQGQRVLCVVGESASIIRYFTFDRKDRVGIVEFYNRPLDPREIPVGAFRPDVLLVEARSRFQPWVASLDGPAAPGPDDLYWEVVKTTTASVPSR